MLNQSVFHTAALFFFSVIIYIAMTVGGCAVLVLYLVYVSDAMQSVYNMVVFFCDMCDLELR